MVNGFNQLNDLSPNVHPTSMAYQIGLIRAQASSQPLCISEGPKPVLTSPPDTAEEIIKSVLILGFYRAPLKPQAFTCINITWLNINTH